MLVNLEYKFHKMMECSKLLSLYWIFCNIEDRIYIAWSPDGNSCNCNRSIIYQYHLVRNLVNILNIDMFVIDSMLICILARSH